MMKWIFYFTYISERTTEDVVQKLDQKLTLKFSHISLLIQAEINTNFTYITPKYKYRKGTHDLGTHTLLSSNSVKMKMFQKLCWKTNVSHI